VGTRGLDPFRRFWLQGAVLTALFILLAMASSWNAGIPDSRRFFRATSAFVISVGVLAFVVLVCARPMAARQREVSCPFDLPAVRDAMEFLQSVSQPGDVVFTDDWDVFPLYFYHNHLNHYIVGLDPKFTQGQRPDLWERFVRVSRGEVPRRYTATWRDGSGKEIKHPMNVKLTDIREYFGARFVVVDSDHRALAKRLADAPDFAELIYPQRTYEQTSDAPYVIFRVKDVGEPASPEAEPQDADVHLDQLAPLEVQQDYLTLQTDTSVEGKPLRVGRTFGTRGLGTHAPSTLIFEIPPGSETFTARVGVHNHRNKRGSAVIVVKVDDREVFRSPLLLGGDDAVDVRLPVSGASRLTLIAEPTDDGNHFDHVDWIDPRFERAKSDEPSAP
jgi:hypothetical protein